MIKAHCKVTLSVGRGTTKSDSQKKLHDALIDYAYHKRENNDGCFFRINGIIGVRKGHYYIKEVALISQSGVIDMEKVTKDLNKGNVFLELEVTKIEDVSNSEI